MGIIKINVTNREKVFYPVCDGEREIVINQQDKTNTNCSLDNGIDTVL